MTMMREHPSMPLAKQGGEIYGMLKKISSFVSEQVIEKFNTGQVSIGVNIMRAIQTYSTTSNSMPIRAFRLLTLAYSHPLTIVIAVAYSIVTEHYAYCAYYFAGLVLLMACEAYIARAITLCSALKSTDEFVKLYNEGIILIISEQDAT